MQLLVIDHDNASYDWLAQRLQSAGFVVNRARSPGEALNSPSRCGAIALILDLGTASADDGNRAIKGLRTKGLDQPLLVLSATEDWRAKIELLDAGADDVLPKPARTEEIAARLRAIIRRGTGRASSRFDIGPISLDIQRRCAWLNGRCLELSRLEYRLLQLFALYPDRTMSHAEIRHHLGPDGERTNNNATEVLIARLRQKIGKNYIRTVRGLGYRFELDCETESVPA